jgi:hypothetical protein
MIKGTCDVKDPVELEVEPAHQVSCWLYDKNGHTA